MMTVANDTLSVAPPCSCYSTGNVVVMYVEVQEEAWK